MENEKLQNIHLEDIHFIIFSSFHFLLEIPLKKIHILPYLNSENNY